MSFVNFGKPIALILFSLLILGSAFAVPGIPHQFYGFVTVNGAPANGATIVAKINNTFGYGSGTSINGNYGYSPSLFFVENPNGENLVGKTIDFYLNGSKVATSIFVKGGYTRLDLSIGVAPFCGDGTCNAGETCSTCAADCGGCGGGGGSLGGGGGGGGGGTTPSLLVSIEGSCVGQPVVVSVLNSVGNPAKDAKVLVRKDNLTVAEQITPADGKVSFVFEEKGDYTFYVTKNLYTQSSKTVSIGDCVEGQETGETGENANLCANVDCNDGNPCTAEHCEAKTGHCAYENQPDGTVCSAKGTCRTGVCEEPVEGQGTGLGPTGFFGLSGGQVGGAGLAIIGLVALLLFFARKRKK